MVLNWDFGIGAFEPVTEEDLNAVEEAQAVNLRISPSTRDEIQGTVLRMTNDPGRRPKLKDLSDDDKDLAIHTEISLADHTRRPPSLLEIRIVMAALRAKQTSLS